MVTGAPQDGESMRSAELRLEPDGESRSEVAAVRAAIQPPAGSLLTAAKPTDIEDLKRAEAKPRPDEQELRGIVDAISQTIVVLGPDGTGLYANRPLLDYTGLTLERLMAPDIRGNPAFFHPEDWARQQDERRQGLTRAEPFEIEWRLRRKDGEYRW